MPISSYDSVGLNDYIKNAKKPTKLWLLNPSFDATLTEFIQDPVQKGISKAISSQFASAWSKFNKTARYEISAWEWLKTQTPVMEGAHLSALKKAVGFHNSDYQEYLTQVRQRCIKISQDHPSLTNWCRKRIADLDFELYDKPKSELNVNSFFIRYGQMTSLLAIEPALAIEQARSLRRDSLVSAALTVLNVLKSENHENQQLNCRANLMLPVRIDGNEHLAEMPAFQAAHALWMPGQPLPKDRVLTVLCETEESAAYMGFWIPLLKGDNNVRLPGAPTAFEVRQGSAVFKSDLPAMTGFGGGIPGRWRNYMETDFAEDMFLSLPFVPPHEQGLPPRATAVFNLNVNLPNEGDGVQLWRAYSPRWLAEASKQAEPFINTALLSHLAVYCATQRLGGTIPIIDSELANWNHLPGIDVAVALLEDKSNDSRAENGIEDLL